MPWTGGKAQDWVGRRTEGGGGANKRKKPQRMISYSRDVENGEDLVGRTEKKRRQESVGSVGVDPGSLEHIFKQ